MQVCMFRMESLRSVVASLNQGEFLVSIGIQDVYLHICIAQSHQHFLHFAVCSLHFKFVALPFELATVPSVLTKVLATLMALLHSRGGAVIPYFDNLFMKAPSLDSLTRFRWIVYLEKSSLTPFQHMEFLGIIFNTRSR